MKKINYSLVCLLFFGSLVRLNAQSSNTFINAFARSYENEAKHEYDLAIKPISDVYIGNSYEMNLRLGWLNYKIENYNQSLKNYQIAVNLSPKSIEAKAGLIYPYSMQNDFEKMQELYTKILEIDPFDINSNYQMGFIFYNKNNFEKARQYFEKVINLYPSGYEPYIYNAWMKINKLPLNSEATINVFKKSYEYEYSKNYKQAIEVLATIYDKNNYDVNLRYGWLYYLSKQYIESVKYYQLAIDLKPNAFEPRYGYVFPASAMGNTENVLTQYKRLIEITPQNTYANYGMGLALYNKNDFKTALPYFQLVVNLYPFNYDGLLMLGWTHYKLGNKEDAKTAFNKVLLNSPHDKSAMEGISLLNK